MPDDSRPRNVKAPPRWNSNAASSPATQHASVVNNAHARSRVPPTSTGGRYGPRDDRSLVQARSASRVYPAVTRAVTLADVLSFLSLCGKSRALETRKRSHSLFPRAAMIDLAEPRDRGAIFPGDPPARCVAVERNRAGERIVHGSRRHSRGVVHGAPVQPHVRQRIPCKYAHVRTHARTRARAPDRVCIINIIAR